MAVLAERAGQGADGCDFLIVGGGSAGCVLAHRLSASGRHRVVLIEAGPDIAPGREPDDVRATDPAGAYANAAYKWAGLRAYIERERDRGRVVGYEQARVIGGGSTINAQVANRGAPEDYDAWAAAGAEGWAWDDVLPCFRRLERDLDFAGPLHGSEGRMPLTRLFPDRWSGFVAAVAEAARREGLAYGADLNGPFRDGHFPIPFTNAYDRRVSAAMAYLDPVTRRRTNLHIVTGATAVRVVIKGGRATGIELSGPGGMETLSAGEVILAAGALQTPALLMRSGLGPGDELTRLGIAPVLALEGVGGNLCCHPTVSISAYLVRAARIDPRQGRFIQMAIRYSSGLEGCPPSDMYVSVAARSSWHAVGRRLGTLQVWPNKVFSRGRVTLAAPDWRQAPRIEFNFLEDARDRLRLVDGLRFLARMLHHAPPGNGALDPFPSAYSDRVKRVGVPTLGNRLCTTALAALLDGPTALRRALLRHVVMPGADLGRLLADDEALAVYVAGAIMPTGHATCTCAMGAAGDPRAVTDSRGRVRGIGGLRIADASVMPALPKANTNLPTMMVAERMSDLILADGPGGGTGAALATATAGAYIQGERSTAAERSRPRTDADAG